MSLSSALFAMEDASVCRRAREACEGRRTEQSPRRHRRTPSGSYPRDHPVSLVTLGSHSVLADFVVLLPSSGVPVARACAAEAWPCRVGLPGLDGRPFVCGPGRDMWLRRLTVLSAHSNQVEAVFEARREEGPPSDAGLMLSGQSALFTSCRKSSTGRGSKQTELNPDDDEDSSFGRAGGCGAIVDLSRRVSARACHRHVVEWNAWPG